MGETIYIRSGFANTSISKSKPFYIPFFQSLETFECSAETTIKGSSELGLFSKDRFLLDIDISVKTMTSQDQESVLRGFYQGDKRSDLLFSAMLETLREFVKDYEFVKLSSKKKEISEAFQKALNNYDIESLEISKFEIERTGLDDYKLDNIIHFEAAKEIVTRIARVQIKDKDFIDKCRKTIAHFDIVDE